jgi:hypothetical protein
MGDALAKFVLGRLEAGVWAQWLRLLFELIYSGLASFLWGFGITVGAIGGTVLSGAAEVPSGLILTMGLGAGALWAVVSMTNLIRSDDAKLLRGVKLVLPGAEALQEMNSNLETITKSTDNKEK